MEEEGFTASIRIESCYMFTYTYGTSLLCGKMGSDNFRTRNRITPKVRSYYTNTPRMPCMIDEDI